MFKNLKAHCASDDLTTWSVAELKAELKALARDKAKAKGFDFSQEEKEVKQELKRRGI